MATILMAAGEGLPFIKSGGLADVDRLPGSGTRKEGA